MSYLIEILSEDGRKDCQLLEDCSVAEDRYFRAFAALTQKSPVRAENGDFVRLVGCYLREVSGTDNEARPMQSSDDPMSGEPIVIEGLFKVIN